MMRKNFLFVLVAVFLLSGALPAFAEVTEMQLDKSSYFVGDFINAQGTVTSDASGLVTIVLRDPNDKFVLLSQAVIQSDDSFEKTIPIDQKFKVSGLYNATAFVLNMTAGKTQSFDFDTQISENNKSFNDESFESFTELENVLNDDSVNERNLDTKGLENQDTKEYPIEPKYKELTEDIPQVADFIDKTKNPQQYLDRYYNESNYKAWFDKNYPDLTIEEAAGFIVPTPIEIETSKHMVGAEIFPEAEAISAVSPPPNSEDNSDFAQLGLAIGGLVVLFGAVYGIKKKIDTNTRHISLNKDVIRRKIISPIIDSNPIGIIQTRLAKGEISIEEYEKLKEKLDKNSR